MSEENEAENEMNQENTESITDSSTSSCVSQLATGILQIYETPLTNVKMCLQELIVKQNKVLEDLSLEQATLGSNCIKDADDMMIRAKVYREKLIGIRKQMANIHHRTQALKKRASYVQSCKEKEKASVIQKRLQEEALIGRMTSSENT